MAVTNLVVATTGADPGIFVRGGGFQLSLKFEKQKNKKNKKRGGGEGEKTKNTGGCGGSSSSAEVWFKSTLFTYKFIFGRGGGHFFLYNCNPLSTKLTYDMVELVL